jgi:hypothetical protein
MPSIFETRAPRWGILLLLPLLSSACEDLLGMGGEGDGVLEILSSSPASGAEGVPVESTVTIRFSQRLDTSTVGEAVGLRDGDRIILTTTYLKDGRVVLLEPTDPLDFGTVYTITVNGGLKSGAGNTFGSEHSWTFRTEGAALPNLEADSLRNTLQALAHDSMRGRGSGTPDEIRAAQYLLERFESYGLGAPVGGGLQTFEAFSQRLQRDISSQNVLATVPGSGALAEEWVVVGAHYDHIGVRVAEDGSRSLNNGADDNASGTALVLEMARVFREYVRSGGMPSPNRRSVLFAAFGAEELGLLGSCHYVDSAPAVPLEGTRAMLNFDMVGRLRDDVILPRGFESWAPWTYMVRNANRTKLLVVEPPGPCDSCSDHACFRRQEIPYLWFFTGTHPQYHTPADDAELINLSGLARIGDLSLRVLTRLVIR